MADSIKFIDPFSHPDDKEAPFYATYSPPAKEKAPSFDVDFLKNHEYIQRFAVFGDMIVVGFSHTIFVYRDPVAFVENKKNSSNGISVKWVWDDEADDVRNPVAKFQPNEAGWNYALGFIRQFGGEGVNMVYVRGNEEK